MFVTASSLWLNVSYGVSWYFLTCELQMLCVVAKNIEVLLPLLQEYQVDGLLERCEEFLCSQPSSVSQYFVAQQYNLQRLKESVTAYMHRAPLSRLCTQSRWDELDPEFVKDLLMERCERFETHLDALREVRMVLERKKPTTFPGQHLLCEACTAAREQQVCSALEKNAAYVNCFLCVACV